MANDVIHHIGRLANTDTRLAIIFPRNPHQPDTALVVNTDALPPRLHDAMMDVLQKEGQSTPVLATALQRRIFTDTGVDLMNTLHMANAIQSVSIDQVILYPKPNIRIPLREALGEAPVTQVQPQDYSTRPPLETPQPLNNAPLDTTYNPHLHNSVAGRAEEAIAIATNILYEAQLLEDEATRKREQAYQLVPSLRPRPVAAIPQFVETAECATDVPVEAEVEKKTVAKAKASSVVTSEPKRGRGRPKKAA